jgi:hypothetical protein
MRETRGQGFDGLGHGSGRDGSRPRVQRVGSDPSGFFYNSRRGIHSGFELNILFENGRIGISNLSLCNWNTSAALLRTGAGFRLLWKA